MLILIVSPLNLFEERGGGGDLLGHGDGETRGVSALQFSTVLVSFLLTLPFLASQSVIRILNEPYGSRRDNYNVDALMGSTEQCMFASLRSRFDQAALTPCNRPMCNRHV